MIKCANTSYTIFITHNAINKSPFLFDGNQLLAPYSHFKQLQPNETVVKIRLKQINAYRLANYMGRHLFMQNWKKIKKNQQTDPLCTPNVIGFVGSLDQLDLEYSNSSFFLREILFIQRKMGQSIRLDLLLRALATVTNYMHALYFLLNHILPIHLESHDIMLYAQLQPQIFPVPLLELLPFFCYCIIA